MAVVTAWAALAACEDDAAADAPDAVADTVGDAVAGVTFEAPHAIFVAKCVPCHSETEDEGAQRIGDVDIDVAYAGAQLPSYTPECEGMTKGACALVRVQLGEMPLFGFCSGDPAADASKPACLTQAEQEVLRRWIDDGELGPAR